MNLIVVIRLYKSGAVRIIFLRSSSVTQKTTGNEKFLLNSLHSRLVETSNRSIGCTDSKPRIIKAGGCSPSTSAAIALYRVVADSGKNSCRGLTAQVACSRSTICCRKASELQLTKTKEK